MSTGNQNIDLIELNDPRVVAKAILDQQTKIIEQNDRIIEILSSSKSINEDLHDVLKALDWKIWEYFRPDSER